MDHFRSIGRALTLLRERVRLSQREVERLSGVSQSNQSRYETGSAAPRLPSLDALLTAYGATVRQLAEALEAADRGAADISEGGGSRREAPESPSIDQRFEELEARLIATVEAAVKPKAATARKGKRQARLKRTGGKGER